MNYRYLQIHETVTPGEFPACIANCENGDFANCEMEILFYIAK